MLKKPILITGGAGFIGANAAAHFLKRGQNVIVADNFSRRGSLANAAWLHRRFGGRNLEIVQADIPRDVFALARLVAKAKVVIHSAAQVAVTSSLANPSLDFEVNCKGTFNLLETARHAGHRPIILYTSTNKVYGALPHLETVEQPTRYAFADRPHGVSEAEPLDFHSPYGCSKGAAEQYVRDYARSFGLPTVVFRQSCVYGERQFGTPDQGWVAWFAIAALLGKPITIYGTGKQVRDALFMADLLRAFDLAIANIKTTRGQIYNIGGGPANTVSVLELVGHLERALKRKIRPTFGPPRVGDQPVFVSDIRKAERDFGWKPRIKVGDGLGRMVRWLEKNRDFVAQTI